MVQQRDSLTGLPGRSMADEALKQAIDEGDGVALALLDIDYFAEVNAQFGQEAGDGLLRELGELLVRSGVGDAFRISGDEFAILMPATNLEQAFLRMEELRAQVHGAESHFGLPDARPVSVTIGVAQYPRDAKEPRPLWNAADAALEAAKEGGRNQVGLPPNEEMIMKTCYYPASSARKLKALAKHLRRKESDLLREALDDVLRKHDLPREA